MSHRLAAFHVQGERAYIDPMTGNSDRLSPISDKDIPRFAPNFSVYLVPPDVVCLYSEDRKFLLHGELYCALASAIAGGGKSFRELRRELEKTFPADAVEHALKRLIDKRYILTEPISANEAVAAYWASLGIAPEIARHNLQACRVRIKALDVEGAEELASALAELGVRVSKRAGELTVVLVNDYLDQRLAEINRQHLDEKSPWILVQP